MSHPARRICTTLLALVAAVLLTQAFAEETGRCYSAPVYGTVILPDGSSHVAKAANEGVRLRICFERPLSPVSALHTAYVDGLPVAKFLSYRRSTKARDRRIRPYFLFLRGDHDLLAFEAYVAMDYDTLVSHDLTGKDKGREWAESIWNLDASYEADEPPPYDLELVPARGH